MNSFTKDPNLEKDFFLVGGGDRGYWIGGG